MNLQPMRTVAETMLADSFDKQLSLLPGDEAVKARRGKAIDLVKAGLPTRRVESWHYTDFRRLLTVVPSGSEAGTARAREPLLAGSSVAAILNGAASAAMPAMDGVTLTPLENLLRDGTIAPDMKLNGPDDAIGAINAAFVTDGYSVDIAAGAHLAAPLELQNIHAGGQAHTRFPIRVGAGARATIIERHGGEGAALVSCVSHLTLGEGAEVVYVIVQDQPGDVTHLGQFNAVTAANARLTLFIMNAGGRLVRQEVHVQVAGEGGFFTLRGVNLLAGGNHTDVTMVLDHAAPHTGSTEIIRNVVTDKAHGVFQGRINVLQHAQKTDARMACNTLLLSDDGEFSTKPELEIFADDVACGHGATVAEIDSNHLFYLASRGIGEKTARGMLVKAFLAEVIEEMDDGPLVDALEAQLDQWFSTHG